MAKKTQEDLLGEIDNNKNGYVGRAERKRNGENVDNEQHDYTQGVTPQVGEVQEPQEQLAMTVESVTPKVDNQFGEVKDNNGAPIVPVTQSPEEQGVKAEEQYSPQDTLDPDAIKAFVEKEKQKAAVPENNNIDDILKRIENTEKRREEDEKRRTRNEAIMSLGEGIGALSNLYFTTKGAPNAYNPKEGMTDYQQAVYDRIEKRRRENEESGIKNRLTALEIQRKADLDALTRQYKERELSERARYNDYLEGKGELAQAKQDLEVYKVMNGTWYQQQSIEARKKINELAEKKLAHLISYDEFKKGIAAINAGGYTTTETVNDPTKGEVTKTTVKTPNRGVKNNSSKQTNTRGGNGTPTMFQ